MTYIDYHAYFDKVYGCFLGKCIAGTIGAPFEGMKELMDIKFEKFMLENMLPNDDLDLQILWLEVLERKGISFTTDDLADAFLNKCPYSPGEYAVFKKNYRRGLHPPISGMYNNRYYIEGMGCPIRSEIWACISPGNERLAADLASKDGILDHFGNSVLAEEFLAGVEAAAFLERDIERLVEKGLALIPADSKISLLIWDVMVWCRECKDWRSVRSRIICKYGHPDCTNLYQNMGFILLALYYGKMDFINTTITALNCGYDTDCTCATAGAILGMIHGADYLIKNFGFRDYGYVLGVNTKRRSDRIFDLAEDICRVGVHFTNQLSNVLSIKNASDISLDINGEKQDPVEISVDYHGIPAIGVGDCKKITIHFKNKSEKDLYCNAELKIPENWISDHASMSFDLQSNLTYQVEIYLNIPETIEMLHETNIITVKFNAQEYRRIYSFGIVGASLWKVFGPYWDNFVDISGIQADENYYSYIQGETPEEIANKTRNYHLNACVDLDKEYRKASDKGWFANIYEDKFSINDLIGYQGPCVIYMERNLWSPEDRNVTLHIGHTDAYELWINGQWISKSNKMDWWTAENVHVYNCYLTKGTNTILLKLARRTEIADFSLIFLQQGEFMEFPEHFVDFASLNQKRVEGIIKFLK